MSEPKQKFSASLAKDAVYQQGLRSFMEYRDLGIADATHGKMRAHIVRVKQGGDTHDLHTTGLHKHECDFQMFYVLKGSIKFIYEGQGERTFGPGDCANKSVISRMSWPMSIVSRSSAVRPARA